MPNFGTERRDEMKEFFEEYGGVVILAIVGMTVLSGFWKILQLVS